EVNKGRLTKETLWTDYQPPRLQKAAAAIYPIAEINKLFAFIVTPIQTVLLVLTFMICIVSGISILVSIYNSMSDRRNEIAVMRALGANRSNIFTIILVESSMLGLFGLGLGWLAGHGTIAASSTYVDEYAGVSVGFFDLASPINEYIPQIPLNLSSEFFLLPGILVLAVLVGVVPAISAYRTDVSENLGK
ncbi:MAG: FtsX-like permease family protein, partial [Planctomycetota bacterium]|nr:FtsX-like permease family protein [Planctomycetota bacterium]